MFFLFNIQVLDKLALVDFGYGIFRIVNFYWYLT